MIIALPAHAIEPHLGGPESSNTTPGTVTERNVRPTFRFPPVIVTFTNRRVYVILFFARPLGVFFL